MKNIFGVSSTTPINKKLKNGYTMYEWIMRQKCFPAFCMRTLCGENSITKEEIDFFKSKDCKIGLVIRNLTEVKISTVNGTEDALNAIEAAKELNVPQNCGIAIFAEVKPEWSINHNWMISFAQTLVSNGYTPGFIGNTDSSKNFNFDRQCSHFVEATIDVNQFGAIYGATEPMLDSMPTEWTPYCPSALEPNDISLWFCGNTRFNDIEVDDVYAVNNNILENMW